MKKFTIALTAAALIATCSVLNVATFAAGNPLQQVGAQVQTSFQGKYDSIADELESDMHGEISSTLVDMKKRRVDVLGADGCTLYTAEDAAAIDRITATLDPDTWTLVSEIPASATPIGQYVLYEEGKKGLATLFNKDIAVRFTVYDQSYIYMEVLTVDGQGNLSDNSSMRMRFAIPDSAAANLGSTAQYVAK